MLNVAHSNFCSGRDRTIVALMDEEEYDYSKVPDNATESDHIDWSEIENIDWDELEIPTREEHELTCRPQGNGGLNCQSSPVWRWRLWTPFSTRW